MPRRGSSSGRRRRRDEEDEDDLPSDDTSDTDFVADSEEAAEDDDADDNDSDAEGFAPDEDDLPTPTVPVPAMAPPVPAMAPPVPIRIRNQARGRRRRRGKKARGDGPPLPWKEWEEANEGWLDEREAADGDGDGEATEAAPAAVPTADPAPEVVLPLLRFQKEWLAWALAQEASVSRGGILADEMGMGKTIQAISLVLTARRLRPPDHHSAASSSSSSVARPMRRVGCTLVVCPVVAVIQWTEEIERHTASGSVRVLIYHGAKRGAQKFDFNNYDFVITTYSTIEMKVHLKYHCGPNAIRTEAQAKQQSKKWDSGKGKVKGKRRVNKKGDEANTGFQELADELGSQSRGQSPLHSVRWERIILDEAHFIKDRRCNTARAVFALESEYKWALSGTPLQNRVGELYSLVCN